MISNNPAFLQEQDFHAKHSDLLQAAREGKAWEPADNPRFGLCSQLVTSEWRYVSRIANIDISDVPDAESTARKYVSEAESPGLVELAECSTIRPSGSVGTVTLTALPPLKWHSLDIDISDASDAEEPSLSEMLKAAPSGPVGTVVRVSLPPLNCRNMNLDISDRLCAPSSRLTKEEWWRLQLEATALIPSLDDMADVSHDQPPPDPPRPPRYDSRCAGSGARVWWPSPRYE